jgi:hypothetical protein
MDQRPEKSISSIKQSIYSMDQKARKVPLLDGSEARKVHLLYRSEGRKVHYSGDQRSDKVHLLYVSEARKVHVLYGPEARKVHLHYRTEWPENTSQGEGQQLRLFMVISNAGKWPRLLGAAPH